MADPKRFRREDLLVDRRDRSSRGFGSRFRGYDRAEVEQLLDDVVDPHAG
jgi:DivIVA domain-containing protein